MRSKLALSGVVLAGLAVAAIGPNVVRNHSAEISTVSSPNGSASTWIQDWKDDPDDDWKGMVVVGEYSNPYYYAKKPGGQAGVDLRERHFTIPRLPFAVDPKRASIYQDLDPEFLKNKGDDEIVVFSGWFGGVAHGKDEAIARLMVDGKKDHSVTIGLPRGNRTGSNVMRRFESRGRSLGTAISLYSPDLDPPSYGEVEGTRVSIEFTKKKYEILEISVDNVELRLEKAPRVGFRPDGYRQEGEALLCEVTEDGFPVGEVLVGKVDPAWTLVASAQFDSDAEPELVFANAKGQVGYFEVEDRQLVAWFNLGSFDPSWTLRGAMDLDHDGFDDLLFDRGEGDWMARIVADGITVADRELDTAGLPDGSELIGVADSNGDGWAEAFFETDGRLYLAPYVHEAFHEAKLLAPLDELWKAVAVWQPHVYEPARVMLRNHATGEVGTFEVWNGQIETWISNGWSVEPELPLTFGTPPSFD